MQKIQDILMLSFLPGPLEKLHVGQHGNTPLSFLFDPFGGLCVPPLNPNEDVGVKEHDIDLP
jgi:hypothetical protein